MSQKITLDLLNQQAQEIKEQYVEKTIEWVIEKDGKLDKFSGQVDILVAGQRSWGSTKAALRRMDEVKKAGQDVDPYLIVDLVKFDGQSATAEQVDSFQGVFILALIQAIREVNPHLFPEKETKGKS